MGKGSSSPPPAPDYSAAARAQGAADKETAIAQSRLNNPNVINPYGSQIYTEGATADARPTVRQTLSPDQLAILDQDERTRQLLGGLGQQGAEGLQGVVGRPFDLTGMPPAPGNAQATRDRVYNAQMTRVNEDYDRRLDEGNSNLIAAGIRPGTKAYDNARFALDRARNDAANQAYLSSGDEASRDIGLDAERRRTAIGELLAQRQTPLNEVSALMSGSQVTNPFAIPGQAATTMRSPPIFDAAMAQYGGNLDAYNARQGQNASLTSGLFSLGSAAIGAYPWSDIRLKSNINRIGEHPLGIGIYEYDIFGEHEIGVMAQELIMVRPEAVRVHPSGYLMVDYDMIGGRPNG